jgi:hypothetical protein
MNLPRLKKDLLKRLRLRESWIIFFFLGMTMMNYPFIDIFSKASNFLGFPLLYLYLQIGWVVSILVIYLFVRAQEEAEDGSGPGDSP